METVTLTEGKDTGKLLVYAGGLRLNNPGESATETLFYLTDYPDYLNNPWEASHLLLLDLCKATMNAKGYTIYVHNLGGFDGIYLLKPFVELLGPIGVLMDKSKDIISLTLPKKVVLKDSLRIFPASLNSLSKMFDVPIPKGVLDHKRIDLTNLVEMRREVLEYLSKDLISLLDVMNAAAESLFKSYNVDLTTAFSASSLAMKIYRTSFIPEYIPTLPKYLEKMIRSGYRGGATQVFKQDGRDLHYYDINSLYPQAMKSAMPHYYLGYVPRYEINFETFFGFLDVEIYAGSVKTPVLQHQSSDIAQLTYPKGVFRGIYFSEELKQARGYGYEIRILGGYAFSSADLFKDYVDHFYAKKAVAKGGERFLVKLLLNGLYGYFGRQSENLETKLIANEDMPAIESKYRVLESTPVTLDYNLVVYDPTEGDKKGRPALSNVAIAAATTAESRMIINPYKVNPENPCYYSDTDSVFLEKPLDAKHIGAALGLMKDELEGETITEALFIAPKCYGYKTSAGDTKVVTAGFTRGDITWDQFKDVAVGGSVSTTREALRRDFISGNMRSVTQTKVLTKNSIVETLWELRS